MAKFALALIILLFASSCIGKAIPDDSPLAYLILVLLTLVSLGSILGAKR